jgi:EAL domain-containing protein (putative c-di-GMP-specific phosphodiesterase class I)
MTAGGPPESEFNRLRTEWLRFKGHVWDVHADLPTLDAVLDDVRRLLEERGTLALVYIDLDGARETEPLHGWEAYDAVVQGFAAALGALRDEGILGPRDVVAVMGVRGDKFVAFMRGNGGTLDAPAVEGRARRLHDRLQALLPRFLPPGPAEIGAFHQGHALVYRDPMLRAERSIHRALDEAMFMSLRQRTREDDRRAHGLDEVIVGGGVVTLYQPIRDLNTMDVVGHEVFTRGPAGGPFEDADHLFSLAQRTGRLVDLERLCRHRALSSARRHLPAGTKPFLNTSPQALSEPSMAGPDFAREVERQGLEAHEVVLEITERVALEERQAYRQVLGTLKRAGFRIAIDDMGGGYSSLQSLVEVEPDYLKFDIALVRDIDRNVIKRSLLETVVELSAKIGAEVIAEGIEHEAELVTLRRLGVTLGQGRHLGPPVMLVLDGAGAA